MRHVKKTITLDPQAANLLERVGNASGYISKIIMQDHYQKQIDAAVAAAKPDVIWAPTGLDRIHVPTGTLWEFYMDNGDPTWFCHWADHGDIYFFRDSSNKWFSKGAERATEGAAMQAALDAAGWKP